MQQTKSLVTSKTFVLAVAQAVAGAIVIFSTAYPQAGWLLVVKSLVDMYLRTITSSSIDSIM